ncbi:nucleotidyltransferase family protein [Microbacterium aureliae]
MRACGLVLAAGAGTRYGGPKGLARTGDDDPWVARAVRMLRSAGCADVRVAVGARAEDVAALVPAGAETVAVADWAEGLGATLRAGLAAVPDDADVVVITPVDTPDAPATAVARILAAAARDPRHALVQAVYRGRPGHPVAIGRAHAGPLAAAASHDRGARPYLVAHGVVEVECADLWPGEDVDTRG